MTGADLWRSIPERVAEARRITDDPVTQQILAIMLADNLLPTVPAGSPEIASVRNYHEALGKQEWAMTFQSFGVPLAAPPEVEEPKYLPSETEPT